MTEPEFTPGYVASVKRMIRVLQLAAERGRRPRFRLPPTDVLFAAAIDTAARYICVNDDARNLVPALLHASHGEGTCFMLRAALDVAGVECDLLTLEELSKLAPIAIVGRGGGSA